MPGVSFAERVAEVIADPGEDAHPCYEHGSGCIVAGRTVLTAGHVVAGAASVSVRYPDKREVSASLDLSFMINTRGSIWRWWRSTTLTWTCPGGHTSASADGHPLVA